MSYPLLSVPEMIAEEIRLRLLELTIANGYLFNISEVARPTRRGENWQRKHLGVGIVQGDSERLTDLDHAGNPPAIAYATEFQLMCVCRDSNATNNAKMVNVNQMAAEVISSLTENQSNWHTFGGLSFNAEIGSPSPFDAGEGEVDGVMLPITVHYRVSENNPYEVRA
jgi:hypothetical protein